MLDSTQNPSPSPDEQDSKKVLDLLGDQPSRRQRRKQTAAAEPEPKEELPSVLDERKKNALDLIDEEEEAKPKKPRTERKPATGGLLPSIGFQSRVRPAAPAEDPLAAALKAAQQSRLAHEAAAATATNPDTPDNPAEPDPPTADDPQAAPEESAATDPAAKSITLKSIVTVKELAELLGLRPFVLIKDLMELEVFANPNHVIDLDIAEKLCELHGFTLERERRDKEKGVKAPEPETAPEAKAIAEPVVEDKLKLRAPIITFMGHVDHGKTSLLDAIRKARVAAGEAGGITQHIGAYTVEHNGQPITFLDTPGHAIFTQMRARGASTTDIVVLVVAADDGFMPQTDEALNHAKAAGVTIIVAINKVDLPAANIDRVYSQMQERDLQPVAWGGDVEAVPVSAHSGQGLDDLLELMSLQADVLELKADPKATARGTVIEARMETGRGPVATVIVQHGTLRPGMPFICGPYSGKIKNLLNDRREVIKEVGPGLPAEVVGFSDLPRVGDEIVQVKSERDAKRISEERQEQMRAEKLNAPQRTRLESLFATMNEDAKNSLRVVLKGDVQGSVEAIADALKGIKSDKVGLDIIHSAAGPISESDVLLASASDAIVLGFNVKLESNAVKTAKHEGVQVKLYSIVYELIDQVEEAMTGLLEPETRERPAGRAKVLQVFKIKRGRAGGCMVEEGKIERKGRARVVRDGQVVYDGPIGTLRRYQDDVDEVKAGNECGIRLGEYNEYEPGDIIECYHLEKIAQAL